MHQEQAPHNNQWLELQERLHIRFKSIALLKQAFTHASYRNEHRRSHIQDNERLEFLGDAVLELIVSEHLYRTYPHLPEGEMTRLRAAMVCEPSLVHYAQNTGFGRYIRLGKGEERSGGRNRPALLADVFEAFIGALYLDQGFEAAEVFISESVIPHFHEDPTLTDFKTRLQEFVQQQLGKELRYTVTEERGPAHAREFSVEVSIGGKVMGEGAGRSKKEAEQRAASVALSQLQGT
ncbi:ribonuclease III [Alicyclobacillus sp. SO9]|uniref:ribonuclease III n=1 Tax=Alicyclobacillus sp. SO9 TaxID=2665646 RepID=UPI0018E8C686|nr:ribonuclease III [Alicyclobacillus sp. SO9]QQE81237.1 ribonuclease III [Alicyclobacillus sp. SO9]